MNLLLVHSAEVLEAYREEVADFFSATSKLGQHPADELLGIWIDALLVTDPFAFLPSEMSDDEKSIYLHETAGRSGLWLAGQVKSAQDRKLSRQKLLSAFLECRLGSSAGQANAPGYFIPVYPQTLEQRALMADLGCLSDIGGDYLAAPWLKNEQGQLRPCATTAFGSPS